MDRNRIPSKFKVSVLNLKKMEKEGVLFLIENGYDMNASRLVAEYAPYGIVTDVNGNHYLIDNEGCGTNIPLETEKDFIVWDKITHDEKESCDIISYSVIKTNLNLESALAIPVKATVSLDKFIRVFGDRLDRNYGNLERFLSGIIDREGNYIKQTTVKENA
jgi:hypothetical protein